MEAPFHVLIGPPDSPELRLTAEGPEVRVRPAGAPTGTDRPEPVHDRTELITAKRPWRTLCAERALDGRGMKVMSGRPLSALLHELCFRKVGTARKSRAVRVGPNSQGAVASAWRLNSLLEKDVFSSKRSCVDRNRNTMANKSIDIDTPDGVCDSYISYPDTDGPFPAVLFYMDGIGIRPVLRQMADRIAANGFYVLLPNLFYRYGQAPESNVAEILKPENRAKLMGMVLSLTPELIVRDAGVFLNFLAAQQEVKSDGEVGLNGYCMGGGMVVRTAAHYPDRVAAAASFHGGRLATDAPDSPHRLVGRITAELYFGHADQDQSMPLEDIARLDESLKAARTRYQAELYTGAMHGFTMRDLPMYNEVACNQHWDRLLGLFLKTLKAA
jgi:carboxymethylenebutenolidase